jgi:hypothetical protein
MESKKGMSIEALKLFSDNRQVRVQLRRYKLEEYKCGRATSRRAALSLLASHDQE